MTLEYVAGFVDGEGCIGFTRTGGKRRYVPRISITNTNLEILYNLQSQFGGCISRLSHRKINWKQGYHLTLTSRQAITFITRIEPFLQLKREQAQLILLWDLLRPGKGHQWPQEDLEIIASLVANMRCLNLKGHRVLGATEGETPSETGEKGIA